MFVSKRLLDVPLRNCKWVKNPKKYNWDTYGYIVFKSLGELVTIVALHEKNI
jgi:hypothetical protein